MDRGRWKKVLNTFLSLEKRNYANKIIKTINESEILKSIRNLSNRKTPGSDGLPAKFYKYFWIDIKNILTQSIQYGLSHGELLIEQKRGSIPLFPPPPPTPPKKGLLIKISGQFHF